MMHDPCFDGFITHRFTDATVSRQHADQAAVEHFKCTTPGRVCKPFNLSYVTVAFCSRRLERRGNESDMMHEIRTSVCRECQGAK